MPQLNHNEITECRRKIADFLGLSPTEKNTLLREIRKKGSFPRATIYLFPQIIESYFSLGKNNQFSSVIDDYPGLLDLIRTLAIAINDSDDQDIHYLFFLDFNHQECSVNLAEFLSRLFAGNLTNFRYELVALANTIALIDPSAIVHNCSEVLDVYKPKLGESGLGPKFTFAYFKNVHLSLLRRGAHSVLKNEILNYSRSLKDATAFTPKITEGLKRLFAIRWNGVDGTDFKGIKGTAVDYTHANLTEEDGKINAVWIWLAHALNGAKITPSIYDVLMPTIVNRMSFFTGRRLEEEPLSHYVLSKDGRLLISLRDCVDYYKRKGILLNCSAERLTLLDRVEVERMRYADARYHTYHQLCLTEKIHMGIKQAELPVMQSTVDIVYELVKRTLQRKPTTLSNSTIDHAYFSFCQSLDNLDCRAQVIHVNPTDNNVPSSQDLAQVLALQKILFIRRGDAFVVGFCNMSGQYEERQNFDPGFLDGYQSGEYIASGDFCSISMSFVPRVNELSHYLGLFNCGYIRVINSETGINELYFANVRANQLLKLDLDITQLTKYDQDIQSTTPIRHEIGSIPCLVNLAATLPELQGVDLEQCCAISMSSKPSSLKNILRGFKHGIIQNIERDEFYVGSPSSQTLTLLELDPLQKADLKAQIKWAKNPKSLGLGELTKLVSITGHIADHKYMVDKILSSLKNCTLTRLDEERSRLYSQRVFWNGEEIGIYEVLSCIERGDVKEGCITELGKYLLKWILDHHPWMEVTDEIEQIATVKLMRSQSLYKLCSDAEPRDNSEKQIRNQKLMYSLLTYDFSIPLMSLTQTLQFWDYSKVFDDLKIIKDIFQRLKQSLTSDGEVEDVFSNIMSEIIVPKLVSGQWEEIPKRIQSWLNLIRSRDFFRTMTDYVDINRLFVVMDSFACCLVNDSRGLDENNLSHSIYSFLDDILSSMLQPKSHATMNVRANVLLNNLLSTFNEEQFDFFKSLLKEHDTVSLQKFQDTIYKYARKRIIENDMSTNVLFLERSPTTRRHKVYTEKTHEWGENASVAFILCKVQMDLSPHNRKIPREISQGYLGLIRRIWQDSTQSETIKKGADGKSSLEQFFGC